MSYFVQYFNGKMRQDLVSNLIEAMKRPNIDDDVINRRHFHSIEIWAPNSTPPPKKSS